MFEQESFHHNSGLYVSGVEDDLYFDYKKLWVFEAIVTCSARLQSIFPRPDEYSIEMCWALKATLNPSDSNQPPTRA